MFGYICFPIKVNYAALKYTKILMHVYHCQPAFKSSPLKSAEIDLEVVIDNFAPKVII